MTGRVERRAVGGVSTQLRPMNNKIKETITNFLGGTMISQLPF